MELLFIRELDTAGGTWGKSVKYYPINVFRTGLSAGRIHVPSRNTTNQMCHELTKEP